MHAQKIAFVFFFLFKLQSLQYMGNSSYFFSLKHKVSITEEIVCREMKILVRIREDQLEIFDFTTVRNPYQTIQMLCKSFLVQKNNLSWVSNY
eukprot:UN01747